MVLATLSPLDNKVDLGGTLDSHQPLVELETSAPLWVDMEALVSGREA